MDGMNGGVTCARGTVAENTTLASYENDNSSNSENESTERRGQGTTRLNARIRRLRANDRERRRIQSINGAMEALRRAIPNTKHNTKITKLQLLRLAQDYIRTLSEVLKHANADNAAVHDAGTIDMGLFSYSPYEEAGVAFFPENYQESCFAYGFQGPQTLSYTA